MYGWRFCWYCRRCCCYCSRCSCCFNVNLLCSVFFSARHSNTKIHLNRLFCVRIIWRLKHTQPRSIAIVVVFLEVQCLVCFFFVCLGAAQCASIICLKCSCLWIRSIRMVLVAPFPFVLSSFLWLCYYFYWTINWLLRWKWLVFFYRFDVTFNTKTSIGLSIIFATEQLHQMRWRWDDDVLKNNSESQSIRLTATC